MNKRTRATDNDLGEIQKSYIDHLKGLLDGSVAEDHLTTAVHTGIRSMLKDNAITVDPDLMDAADHRKAITLTLVGEEVTDEDIRQA